MQSNQQLVPTIPLVLQFLLGAIMLTTLFSTSSAACEATHCGESSAGEFLIKHSDGRTVPAVLLSTDVAGRVDGMIASIEVTQSFENNSLDWVNGRYVFPLPENAAVNSLKITIGDRVIKGEIQEKQQAKLTFAKAQKAGKKGGLLEQHRPNLFSVSVANIGPGEKIVAEIKFVDRVDYQQESFSYRFPTTITPRYIPGNKSSDLKQIENQINEAIGQQQIIKINNGQGWAADTEDVPDASAITPPQSRLLTQPKTNRFSLRIVLAAGLPLSSVHSNSHAISQHPLSGEAIEVELANGSEPMNRDLLLSWQPQIGAAPKAALFQQNKMNKQEEEHYAMLMVMPPSANTGLGLPRDVTFIIDSSGSMAGASMPQAKRSLQQALSYLTVNDRFNVIDFDSHYRPLFSRGEPANRQNISAAKIMINNIQADGGTEMAGALDFALQQANDENYLQQIIFITDGSIGNEDQLFKLISRKLGNARLFTIGIGHAPNSHFMRKAAEFGRGSYTYVNDLKEVNTKMAELFAKITQPMLRDIKLNWPVRVEQYPQKLPDLYAGEPITVLLKSAQPLGTVSLSGEILGQHWQQTIKVDASDLKARDKRQNIDTLWAREKIESLMDLMVSQPKGQQSTQQAITELAIAHQLMTKFTSFVAVEQKTSKPAEATAKQAELANLMPKASTMVAPQTATPAQLLRILGLLLMFGSLLFARLTGIGLAAWSKRIEAEV